MLHEADYEMSATWSILALVTTEHRKGTKKQVTKRIIFIAQATWYYSEPIVLGPMIYNAKSGELLLKRCLVHQQHRIVLQ